MPRAPQRTSGHFIKIAPYSEPMNSSAPYHGQPQALPPHYQSRDSSSWLAPPSRPSTSWSPEDDARLMSARQQGMNWQVVASRIFTGKTANACRKRHERLMERLNAEDWDGVKLELLAKEYMEVRQQMWTVLGDRLNEKWTVMEAKVCPFDMKYSLSTHTDSLFSVHGKRLQEPSSSRPCCEQEKHWYR